MQHYFILCEYIKTEINTCTCIYWHSVDHIVFIVSYLHLTNIDNSAMEQWIRYVKKVEPIEFFKDHGTCPNPNPNPKP